MAVFADQGQRGEPRYLFSANREITRALEIWPENSDYLLLSAQIDVWLEYLELEGSTAANYETALAKIRLALENRPSHAKSWALLAEYKAYAGQRDQEMYLAREKALELGGANQKLVEKMLRL
jgi:tetratricopeptide (TPR) repeat protein